MENSNNFRRFSTRKRKKPSKFVIKEGKNNYSCEDDPESGAYKMKIEIAFILLSLRKSTN